MKDRWLFIVLLCFISSCSNNNDNIQSNRVEIDHASLLLRAGANSNASQIHYDFQSRGLYEPYDSIFENNWDIKMVDNYCKEIDEIVNQIYNGYNIEIDETEKSLCDKKRDIIRYMKSHSYFDSKNRRILLNQFILKYPRNSMFILPTLNGLDTDQIVEKLLTEKLSINCMAYYFSSVWYPTTVRSAPSETNL